AFIKHRPGGTMSMQDCPAHLLPLPICNARCTRSISIGATVTISFPIARRLARGSGGDSGSKLVGVQHIWCFARVSSRLGVVLVVRTRLPASFRERRSGERWCLVYHPVVRITRRSWVGRTGR